MRRFPLHDVLARPWAATVTLCPQGSSGRDSCSCCRCAGSGALPRPTQLCSSCSRPMWLDEAAHASRLARRIAPGAITLTSLPALCAVQSAMAWPAGAGTLATDDVKPVRRRPVALQRGERPRYHELAVSAMIKKNAVVRLKRRILFQDLISVTKAAWIATGHKEHLGRAPSPAAELRFHISSA